MIRSDEIYEKTRNYVSYRKHYGVKDPYMLQEIDEAYFSGAFDADKSLETRLREFLKTNTLTLENIDEFCKQNIINI